MSEKKYIIIIAEYDGSCEAKAQILFENIEKSIANYGKISKVYQGTDRKIVSAVEKILKLTQ